ncbi:MAG: hypothetical protein KGO96_10340 [Elusimicrobia bacterium]|nr:hypothetical protein [Elusimicrobiota bacterium]
MSSRDQYTSTVIDYVRRYPQVVRDSVEVENGRSSHRKLRFDLTTGQHMTMTLNAPGNPNHGGTAEAKLQDVRRLLGGPPPDGMKKMSSTICSDVAPAAEHLVGKLSLYRDGRLRFYLPQGVFPDGTSVRIDRLDRELWQLKPDPSAKGAVRSSSAVKDMLVLDTVKQGVGLEPFGVHPMDIVLVDGAAVVSPKPGDRPAIAAPARSKPVAVKNDEGGLSGSADAESLVSASPGSSVVGTEKNVPRVDAPVLIDSVEMRRRLELIREVERTTAYRLVVRATADGERRIAFEAPKIE